MVRWEPCPLNTHQAITRCAVDNIMWNELFPSHTLTTNIYRSVVKASFIANVVLLNFFTLSLLRSNFSLLFQGLNWCLVNVIKFIEDKMHWGWIFCDLLLWWQFYLFHYITTWKRKVSLIGFKNFPKSLRLTTSDYLL